MEQTVLLAQEIHQGAEVRTAQYASDRLAAEKRAESAEARVAELEMVLREFPPMVDVSKLDGEMVVRTVSAWFNNSLSPWLARREAALEGK